MIRSFEKRAEQKISGFQSPAADYLEGRLDISEKLVIDPHCTYYFQMQGDAMMAYGICNGDILIIDRSLKAQAGSIVIAFIAGELSCRMFGEQRAVPLLINKDGRLELKGDHDISIWGVVTCICRGVLPKTLKVGRYSHVCTL